MSAEDARRWDVRHGAVDATGPLPPDGLLGHPLPAGGRALDVACGRGAVAVWLAGRGFAVDAVDASAVGLAAGRELAGGAGVRWWHHDLDAGLPAGCAGPYDVIVCQRYRDPTLYPVLAGLLAPAGLLLITVLSEVGDEPGRFRAAPGELFAAFASLGTLDVLDHHEADGEARLLARRP